MRNSAKILEDFFKGSIWKDIMDELEVNKEMITSELCKTSWSHESGSLEHDKDSRVMLDENLRGAYRMITIIEGFPDLLISKSQSQSQSEQE